MIAMRAAAAPGEVMLYLWKAEEMAGAAREASAQSVPGAPGLAQEAVEGSMAVSWSAVMWQSGVEESCCWGVGRARVVRERAQPRMRERVETILVGLGLFIYLM